MQDNTKDGYGAIIAKKSERLVTALYVVTDLIDGSEPIKNGLRKNAVSLLSCMNALMQYDVKDRTTEFASSLKSVMEIISLLHVAAATGLISEMNGKLLIDGFRMLQAVLEKRQPIVTKDMLSVDQEESMYENTEAYPGIVSTSYDALTLSEVAKDGGRDVGVQRKPKEILELSNTNNKRQIEIPNKGQFSTPRPGSLHSDLMQHAHTSAPVLSSSFQTRKQSRRDQIVALFVKGVDVSIKDIAARIKGCSEKTIQRELNALVYDNVIERIGEKRWSRYILR